MVIYESISYVFSNNAEPDPPLNITVMTDWRLSPKIVPPEDFRKLTDLEAIQLSRFSIEL